MFNAGNYLTERAVMALVRLSTEAIRNGTWNGLWVLPDCPFYSSIREFYITASRLFTQPIIQAQIKENIKAPRHWALCGEFTGDRWIPRIKGQ